MRIASIVHDALIQDSVGVHHGRQLLRLGCMDGTPAELSKLTANLAKLISQDNVHLTPPW